MWSKIEKNRKAKDILKHVNIFININCQRAIICVNMGIKKQKSCIMIRECGEMCLMKLEHPGNQQKWNCRDISYFYSIKTFPCKDVLKPDEN